jgi:KDO2-lipid IV(A) lauroyltransferase
MKAKGGPLAWLQYAAIRAAAFVFHMFPVNLNLETARLLGRIWWRIDRRHRDRTREHLRSAWGDGLAPAQVDRIARRCMEHWVMFVVELMFTPRLINDWTWARYVDLPAFDEALRVLLKGRGAILVTGHYGNFELTGHLLALYGFEVLAIMRPLDNAYLNRYVVRTRRAAGLELLDKKGASEQAEEALRRGAAVGFIADQDAGRKGLFVDFFGRKASTYKSIGLLAMAAEVPIIVGCARRTGTRFHYQLVAERIIYPHEWRNRDDPLTWITQEYTAAIERFVRQEPSQYLWLHRRWKTRPRNERLPKAASQPQTWSATP